MEVTLKGAMKICRTEYKLILDVNWIYILSLNSRKRKTRLRLKSSLFGALHKGRGDV